MGRFFSTIGFRLGLLFLLGLLLFLGATSWRQSNAIAPPLAPLPQDPAIQVYFNHSQSAFYTEPYRQQQRLGDDLEELIVGAIASARSSVDLAVQELNLPRVAQVLADRHQAGVRVRVIVENQYRQSLSRVRPDAIADEDERDRKKYQEFVQLVDLNRDGQFSDQELNQRDAIAILENSHVPLIDDTADGSKGSDLMHHKFLVIDDQTIIVGSANFSLSDIHGDFSAPASLGNANHLLKISSPDIARLFTQEFNLMWGDGPAGQDDSLFGLKKPYRSPKTITLAPGSSVTVQFSPTSTRRPWDQSSNGLIGRTLNRARRSVDLALFVFSDQTLSNILDQRHRQGVQVRALIEPSFFGRDYSEALDLLGVAYPNRNCRYETGNAPWNQPVTTVGMPTLPEGDLLHHKVGLIDGRTVISGSQNWSDAANSANDETVLVIDNATVAAHFQREFDRLYSGAMLGIPDYLQKKMQQQQSRCRARS